MPSLTQKLSNANKLVTTCETFDLFVDRAGTGWIGLPTGNGYPEFVPLRSQKFAGWACAEFYRKFGTPIGEKALRDAQNTLYGIASQTVKDVYVRVASLPDAIYVDLGQGYIEITADGWDTIQTPPVPFRRPAGMRPLPFPAMPFSGVFYDAVADLLGLSRDDLLLIIGWIFGAFGSVEYPILVINGEQGSGKSTLAEILKRLIDPSEILLRSMPRDEQALAIGAANSWVLAFDNLSGLPDWLSDALCRISTGAGYSARRLYQDLEEVFAQTRRPVILNGIPELASRGDLQDRSIVITLPPISELQRRTKAAIMAKFEAALPSLLSMLFETLQYALALQGENFATKLPRMADFSLWAARACEGMSYGSGRLFLEAYRRNRQNATLALLDLSPIAQEIQAFANKNTHWTGTATDLKDRLILQCLGTPTEKTLQHMSVKAFSNELRRLAPVLRQVGIAVEFQGLRKVNGIVGRFIEITDLSVFQKVNVP